MARAPGPQKPEKYNTVGPNYKKYGEQPGYVYVPQFDRYYVNTAELKKYYEDQGLKEKDPSLSDQLLPVAATMGAVYGAKELAPQIVGSYKDGTGLLGLGKDTFSGTKTTPTTAPKAPATSSESGGLIGLGQEGTPKGIETPEIVSATRVPAGEPLIVPPGQGVPEGYTAVGTHESGGEIAAPNESIGQDGSVNFGAYAQGALGAFNMYQGYKIYQEGDKVGGALQAGTGATAMGAAAGSQTAKSALPYLAAANDVYGGYKYATSDDISDEEKTTRVGQQAGLAVADVFTGGLAGLGVGALKSTGFGKKLDKALTKMHMNAPWTKALNRMIGTSNEYMNEGGRLRDLQEAGVYIPEEYMMPASLKMGRKKDDLIAIEQDRIARGTYGNVDFADTRDESLLNPQDIIGYSAFAEKDPNWFKKPLEERLKEAQRVLDAGAVREAKGTIHIDWDKADGPIPQGTTVHRI